MKPRMFVQGPTLLSGSAGAVRMIWLDIIADGAWEDEWEEFDWWGAE